MMIVNESTVTAEAPRAGRGSAARVAAALSAVLLSIVFLASGLWKVFDLPATAERMVQLLVPPALSLTGAFLVAGAETLAGVLLLIPSCRRLGGWLAAVLLVAFMAYMAIFYTRLLGEDCSCFPWVKRVVGPAFFVGDAAMLLVAGVAIVWSERSASIRTASIATLGVTAALAASYAVTTAGLGRPDVPQTVTVDGKVTSLRNGRVLLYFFDPQCTHCEAIARMMSKWNWGDTRLIALPTAEPRFAAGFLNDTGFHAGLSLETDRLRAVAPFTTAPHAVVLDRGKVIGRFNYLQLEEPGFLALLLRSGHVH